MKVKTKSNAAKEVGGALLGMLAGSALGSIFGVGGGGIIGAVGGYFVAKDNRSDVVIPAEHGRHRAARGPAPPSAN